MKKIVFFCFIFIVSLTTFVFADIEINSVGDANVPVKLTQETTQFSVTVPTSLPVDIDSGGKITVATDNKIINNINIFNPII